MKTRLFLSLALVCLVFYGCTSDFPEVTPLQEEFAQTDLDNPETRGVDPIDGFSESSRGGSFFSLPALESGGVLHTGKNYTFGYAPGNTEHGSNFATGIGIKKVGDKFYNPKYHVAGKSPVSIDHVFTEPGTYQLKGNVSYWYGGLFPKEGEVYQTRTYTVEHPYIIELHGPDSPFIHDESLYYVTYPSELEAEKIEWSTSTGNTILNQGDPTKFRIIPKNTGDNFVAVKIKAKGLVYTATKQINVQERYSNIRISGPNKIMHGESGTFSVSYTKSSLNVPNPNIEWKVDGKSLNPPQTGASFTYTADSAIQDHTVSVHLGEGYTASKSFQIAWSGPGILVPLTINNYQDNIFGLVIDRCLPDPNFTNYIVEWDVSGGFIRNYAEKKYSATIVPATESGKIEVRCRYYTDEHWTEWTVKQFEVVGGFGPENPPLPWKPIKPEDGLLI